MTDKDKKDSSKATGNEYKRPKSELDETFLRLTEYVLKTHGLKSPSALSKELGKGVDFISKIRRGLQHAPPDAWDALFAKYPDARNITTNNVTAHAGGQAVGTIQGDNYYAPTTLEACQLELDQHKRDVAALRSEIDQLKQQVADRDRLIASQEATIASKDEIIRLLRGRV